MRPATVGLAVANRLIPKSANKIVLHSPVDIDDDLLAVAQELTARGYQPFVVLKRMTSGPLLQQLAGPVRTLPKNSVRALAHLATASHVLTTSSTFAAPLKCGSQTTVRIWPARRQPADSADGRPPSAEAVTYAPVRSTIDRAFRAAESRMDPLRLPIIGEPRNDRLLRADAPRVRHDVLGREAALPTFLWLPEPASTDQADEGHVAATTNGNKIALPFDASDLRRLDDRLLESGVRMVLLTSDQSGGATMAGGYRAIRVLLEQDLAPLGSTLYELMAAVDGLVTDVSPVWMDFLLTDKPLVFALPTGRRPTCPRLDLEPFADWAPGAVVRTVEELVDTLVDLAHGRDPLAVERRLACMRLHRHHDAASTSRLLDGIGLTTIGRPAGRVVPAPDAEATLDFQRPDRVGKVPAGLSRQRRWAYAGLAFANRLIPKSPRRMALYSTVDIEDGVLAVAAEAQRRGMDVTVLLQDSRRGALLQSIAAAPLRAVPKQSLHGVWRFLTSRYVITTSTLHGNRVPPRAQISVALWHGEPPSKVTARFEGRGPVRATCAPVCSAVGRAYRAAAFDLAPENVPVVGAPRNDRMLQGDRGSLRSTILGSEAERTTFLWMPSFRIGHYQRGLRVDGATSGAVFSPGDLLRLDGWLVECGARVVVKIHPRDRNNFDADYRAIRVFGPGDLEALGLTLYPALSAFDALITDMSSVWVDYLLVDRPMIFAFPDVEDYRRGRGLNLEPYEAWVPGVFARTIEEMMAAMRDVVDHLDPMADERARARRRFHKYHDDRSAARLLDWLGLPAAPG